MIGIIRSFFFLALVFGGIGFIVYQIVQFAMSISGKKSQISRDVTTLRDEVDNYLDRLIPISTEELNLFSFHQIETNTSKSLHTIHRGVFTSIYQEPLLAYAHKQYSGSDYSLLLAMTHQNEYLYIRKGARTDVYINDDAIGYIVGGQKLYAMEDKGNDLLASIQSNRLLTQHPISIADREVGQLANSVSGNEQNTRVFQMLEPMNENETEIFKALSFYSLIKEI